MKRILSLISITVAVTAMLAGCAVSPPTSEEVRLELSPIAEASQQEMWDNGLVEEIIDTDTAKGNKLIYNSDNPYYPVIYNATIKTGYLSHDVQGFMPNRIVNLVSFQKDDVVFSKDKDGNYIIDITQNDFDGKPVIVNSLTLTVLDGLIVKVVNFSVSSTGEDILYTETLTYSLDSSNKKLFEDGQKEAETVIPN